MEQLYQNAWIAASGSSEIPGLHGLLKQEYNELLDFIAQRDANLVAVACDGLGTDDTLLIKILCNRSRDQLLRIDEYYRRNPKNGSNGSLFSRIQSECSGNYGNFMQSIVRDMNTLNGMENYLFLFIIVVFFVTYIFFFT